ncbi:MAG: class I SAM-dependent methyltransferase [Clostridia bacterium]|nr:class I SAM-dependent methyltransferase [Clostridia bacterium]
MQDRYVMKPAAAYVRSMAGKGVLPVSRALLDQPLDLLTREQQEQLIEAGQAAGLKMYRFKSHADLPRVKSVLGMLRGIQPQSLLDVGSGRGVFLFTFLQEFPWTEVTSLDLLEHRVELLSAVAAGGMENLTALRQDICAWDMPDGSFDVVTLLEVLEHIPDVGAAVRAAVRLARRYVLVSVPSKPDDNPEHIHLLTKDVLTELFGEAGCTKLSFSGVNGHLIMMASVGGRVL